MGSTKNTEASHGKDRKVIGKIGDFGTTKNISKNKTQAKTKVGTMLYAAPEVFFLDSVVGQEFDTWSLGVILYEMMTMQVPFKKQSHIENVKYKRSKVGDLRLRSIIKNCFKLNPQERPKVKHIVQELIMILNKMDPTLELSYKAIKSEIIEKK